MVEWDYEDGWLVVGDMVVDLRRFREKDRSHPSPAHKSSLTESSCQWATQVTRLPRFLLWSM